MESGAAAGEGTNSVKDTVRRGPSWHSRPSAIARHLFHCPSVCRRCSAGLQSQSASSSDMIHRKHADYAGRTQLAHG